MKNLKLNPDILILQNFSTPKIKTKYSGYIDYMEDEKKQNKIIYEDEKLFEYENYINYMDNEEKQLNLENEDYSFSNTSNNITQKEIDYIKEKFSEAQENNGFLWKTVFSFNNDYLLKNQILSPDGNLDEDLLKGTIRKSMMKMLEKENIKNYIFTGNVHYNTDNIHLHIATVELGNPTRKFYNNSEKKGKYKEAFFDKTTFSLGKRIINSDLTKDKENIISVDNLIRKDVLKNIKLNSLSKTEQEQLKEILNKLPNNKNLWNYNSGYLKNIKKDIRNFTIHFLNKNFPENMKSINNQLDILEKEYYQHYGNSYNSYKENKLEDLYYRAGNKILKELKDWSEEKENFLENIIKKESVILEESFENNISKNFNNTTTNLQENNFKINTFKFNTNWNMLFKNFFNSINFELEEESIKNLKEYKKLEKDIENKGKTKGYGI